MENKPCVSLSVCLSVKPDMAWGASAAQAADWPKLADAPGSLRHALALREASGGPAARKLSQLVIDIGAALLHVVSRLVGHVAAPVSVLGVLDQARVDLVRVCHGEGCGGAWCCEGGS